MTIPADAHRESDDEIIARLKAEAPALQRKLPLEPVTMTELALLPEFTPRLLADTGIARKIPGDSAKVLADQAFFDSRPTLPTDDGSLQSIYWVRREARATIGSQVRPQLGLSGLRDLLARLRGRIGNMRHEHYIGLDVWVGVVDLLLGDPEGKVVLDAVSGATARRAGQIVAVLASLADVLGGSLPAVVDRARTLVAVKVRQDEAARALATYQNRPGIESWIADELSDDGRWAIHLRGGGGVGKTMLLRCVSSPEFADKYRVGPFTVAGVDFDHLDPRYPLVRPLLLFEALESQLVSPTSVPTAELGRAREQFLDAAAAATEEAGGTLPDQRDPVTQGIKAFADLVRLTDHQVVLVFDTVEELAKVDGAANDASPVEATLKRLRELQDALRADGRRPVQVIFAGRRPLRTRADGTDATPGGISVREIEGFDRAEADQYLRRRISGITDEQVEALLDRSRPVCSDGEQLFNPFELAIWASWMIDDKKAGRTFALHALSSYADPYVELRILARISEPGVRVLVAPAALLGRFDRRLLEPTARRAGFDAGRAIQALADQEWVNVVSRDDRGFPLTLEVDEHLQDRLRAAVMEQSSTFPLDWRRLADDIGAEIGARRLVDQQADPFIALVRLLPSEGAWAFWSELEQRVARENAWGWADGLIRRVEPVVARGAPLLPAITATKAVVAGRQPEGSAEASALWRAIVDMVLAGPATQHQSEMLARARLALVGQGVEPTVDDVWIAPVASVAGAVAAALGDGEDLWGGAEESGWFRVATHRLSKEGGYVGSALASLGDTRRAGDGTDLLALAAVLARAPRPDQLSAGSVAWVDWAPPEGLVERCALAAISWTPASVIEDRETIRHKQGLLEDMAARARTRLHDIDAERFAAAYLLRRLLVGAVNGNELVMYDHPERTAYTPSRRPTWELHRRTPRLVDVVALGWAGLGAPERAEDILRDRIEQAVRAGTDPDAVADAQTGLVRLFREYRIDPSSWSLGDIQTTGLAEVEQAVRLIGEGSKGIRISRTAALSARQRAEQPIVMLGHFIPALRRLEIEALDRPETAADELFDLARNPSKGQEIRADMAYVLGVLACARAGIPVPEDLRKRRMHSETFVDPPRLRGKWASGWTPRLQVAGAYASGDDQAARDIASDHPSPELDIAPPVQAMASARSAAGSLPEGESTAASGIRRLTRVRLKPSKPPPVLLVVTVYTALFYGVVLAFVLKLTHLPLWASLAAGVVATGLMGVYMWFWASGVGEAFGRHVLFSVEYPGEGSAASLEVSKGSGTRRFRRMNSRASSFYLAFVGRKGRSLRQPATVSLSAPGKGERFTPADWRVPRRTLLSSVIIAELDVPPVLCTLPWERWLAATSRKPNDMFIWIRPSPGWPATVPPKGPPRFARPGSHGE